MPRSIIIDFPSIEVTVRAELQEEAEPELCDTLWSNLKEPQRMVCRHPVSSGEEFSAEARPPRHPVKSGMGIGRRRWTYATVPLGGVIYAVTGGFGGLSLYYGPCTEPLVIRGSLAGKVAPGDMEKAKRAGRAVWDSQCAHRPMVITVRRAGQ